MVTIFLLLLTGSISRADTSLAGRFFENVVIQRDSGTLEISFAAGHGLLISSSTYETVRAYKAILKDFIFVLSSALDADFAGTDLRGSVWRNSRLVRGDFRKSDLRGAYLHQMEIAGCNFNESDLRDTQWVQVSLDNCSFQGAKYNDGTQLPFDLSTAEEMGMVYVP